jgi:6-phosphogluconolactonase
VELALRKWLKSLIPLKFYRSSDCSAYTLPIGENSIHPEKPNLAMPRSIEVLPDKTALIQRALQLILEKLHTAIAERGLFTIALSGGGTPKPLYEAIAAQDLPWDKIHVFWGDERYVPPNHPDSNEGMARQAWLDQVPIPAANIHPMPTDEADPAVAAQKHEQQIQKFFSVKSGEIPQLDVILLGIGDDAHTASLFPHTAALQVCDHLVTVGNKDGQPRITFTVPLINQARCVMFVVAGASKQSALSHIFAPEGDTETYPSRLIQPQGELWWLLDQAAGQNLS